MTEIVLAAEPMCPMEQIVEYLTEDRPMAFYRMDRLWKGLSGLPVTGVEVAEHLEATLALLEKEGWVRRYEYGSSDSDEVVEVGESTSIRDMLKTIIRLLSSSSRQTGLTLHDALHEIGNTEHGDTDTWSASAKLLDAIVAAKIRPSWDWASHAAWSERRGRTFADVRGLLVTAAEFARQYGPKGGE